MASFRYQRRAHWSDCDPAGIVFFAQYARWMSDGLIEMLLSLGIDPAAPEADYKGNMPSLGFSLRFRAPVRLHQHVTHEICVTKLGRSSLEFGHRILDVNEVSLVEGDEKRVWVEFDRADGSMKSVPIPAAIRVLLGERPEGATIHCKEA